MDKKLQDLAWSVLPKEFKEEVKKEYLVHHESGNMKYSYGYSDALTDFFGENNLISDAEGEEMLTVPRRKVIQKFLEADAAYKSIFPRTIYRYDSKIYFALGKIRAFETLFGHKCRPDESTFHASIRQVEEQKPAEPKFKVGDKVIVADFKRHKVGCATVGKVEWNDTIKEYTYRFNPNEILGTWIESYLELCTEPEENIAGPRNFSQDCDKRFDNVLSDSFRNQRRLNIAVQMVKTITQSPEIVDRISRSDDVGLWDGILHDALYLTDKLIEECENGQTILKQNQI